MKIRIHGNSLRFRLTQRDVVNLKQSGRLEETVTFGPGMRFSYALRVRPDKQQMQAFYNPAEICVELPAPLPQEWTDGELVGLHGQQLVGDGFLKISVEKDFECLESVDSPKADDLYPNPNKICVSPGL